VHLPASRPCDYRKIPTFIAGISQTARGAYVSFFMNKWKRVPQVSTPLFAQAKRSREPQGKNMEKNDHLRVLHLVPARSAPLASVDWNPWRAQPSGSNVRSEQFSNPQTGFFTGRPVAALLQAVLDDALACFQSQFMTEGRLVQREAQEAEQLFLSEDSHSPFSFVSICAVLGLEPEAIRQQLKRWSHSHPATPQRKMRRIAARRPHKEIGQLP
jgi:hypothetical protein